MRTTPIAASRFGILVDGVEIATFSALQGVKSDLGSWSKVEGLAVSWDVARYQLERLALASGASRTPPTLTFTRPRSPDMRLWMWHRTAMQQPAGAKRDLHMHAWLESVQSGQMSPAGRSASPVARYRLVNAWPSKVAAGLARAGSGTTVAMETITLAVERIERA
ncbi:MAG TPA: phage tail protein [Luteimonas sp.]